MVVKLVIGSKPSESLMHSPSSNVEPHVMAQQHNSHPNVVQVFASQVIKLTEDMLKLATPLPTSSSPAPAELAAAA